MSSFQTDRGGIMQAQLMGNALNARSAQQGNMFNQIQQFGAGLEQNDRMRQAQMGQFFGDMQNRGLRGQQGIAGDQMRAGDYVRQMEQQRAMDPFNRASMGHGVMANSFMGPKEQKQTNVEEGGGWLSDFMSFAMPIAGMALGGPGGAAAAGSLSGLGGGGSQAIQSSPIMQGGSNLWNYGGNTPSLGMG